MTFSEENYLKGIYHLTVVSNSEVSTNAIAEMMDTKRPPSLTCSRISRKDLVNYIKYRGVSLTERAS
jgi:DtxR family Mn-dependent transcriptional regulator